MQRANVFYSGRVQGVGFRVTVQRLACGYEVSGTIRNLDDGRVELIAEGSRPELEAFLRGIAESELGSHIARGVETWSDAKGLRGFKIVG